MDTLIPLPPDEDGAQYDDNEPPRPIFPETPEDESEDFFDILTFDNHAVQWRVIQTLNLFVKASKGHLEKSESIAIPVRLDIITAVKS